MTQPRGPIKSTVRERQEAVDLIPDRVRCSQRETVGKMAALKLKMIEAGVFFVVVLT